MKSRKSKTQEIYEFLKQEIAAGTYYKGELLPTDLQISEEFNASRPTVAKAVQKLVNENYLRRKAGYGTYLMEIKDSSQSEKELTLSLLIPELGETDIFEPICGQIANLADANNFKLIWNGFGNLQDCKIAHIEQLVKKYISQNVDGVFFVPLELLDNCQDINQRIINMFKKADIPCVLLDRDVVDTPHKSECDVIGINNSEAGFIIGQHLLEKGCRKIGFVTRPNIASSVNMRFIGMREAVLQAGLAFDALEELSTEDSMEDFAKVLTERKDLDAIAVYNDSAAVDLSINLERLGIKIPIDLKVVAFDDVKYGSLLKTPLTTFRRPYKDIARAAVEVMISRIKNLDQGPRKVLLNGRLIIRESTQ
ncbi:MAG: GntR family transcriptional regulator [Lentisphaerales bacterium]|nr:GntR family transcriptional regulator [Lentisphaerales bacterium]